MAPAHPEDFHLGLMDVLQGEAVENCLANIGVPNLQVLPACGTMSGPMDLVSRSAMKTLVDSLRGSCDMILIDAGPIPGPMDSSVMACCADGVVMVASRGEHSSAIRQAIEHLALIRAPLTGIVLNRAQSRDLAENGRSSSRSSNRSGYSNSARAQNLPARESSPLAFARLGPLAQAVWATSRIAPAFANCMGE